MDSFTAALGRLDPASRALLDLSLRRGMKPEEIGELLGSDPESVVAAREAALEQLATELDMEDASQLDEVRARLAELPAEAWTGTATGAPRPRLSVVKEEPAQRPPAERKRSRLPLLLALLAVAVVALVIVLASSGGDTKTAAKPKANTPAPAPAPKPNPSKPAAKPAQPAAPKETKLIALGTGSGTAALTDGGKRLTLKADGLAPGAYQVWLYNDVMDAVSLTKVEGTKLTLDLKLPANASHYRYVDVSREPADGNPNHSGESVLRVRLAKLSG